MTDSRYATCLKFYNDYPKTFTLSDAIDIRTFPVDQDWISIMYNRFFIPWFNKKLAQRVDPTFGQVPQFPTFVKATEAVEERKKQIAMEEQIAMEVQTAISGMARGHTHNNADDHFREMYLRRRFRNITDFVPRMEDRPRPDSNADQEMYLCRHSRNITDFVPSKEDRKQMEDHNRQQC